MNPFFSFPLVRIDFPLTGILPAELFSFFRGPSRQGSRFCCRSTAGNVFLLEQLSDTALEPFFSLKRKRIVIFFSLHGRQSADNPFFPRLRRCRVLSLVYSLLIRFFLFLFLSLSATLTSLFFWFQCCMRPLSPPPKWKRLNARFPICTQRKTVFFFPLGQTASLPLSF